MSDRPSDGMGLDELREEFDWISEFQSRMAERICGDADVHNLVDYVGKLERENAKLRDENARLRSCLSDDAENARMIIGENTKLRELAQKMMRFFEDGDWCATCGSAKECDAQEQYEEDCLMRGVFHDRMRELGIEVD